MEPQKQSRIVVSHNQRGHDRMSTLKRIGDHVFRIWGDGCRVGGIICGVHILAVNPGNWPRTVREQFFRQILFTGIEALGLILLIAVATGVTVVAQAQLWLGRFGQSDMLSPLLVVVIIREIGPLLVNLVVIGRSGSAVAAEMASMRVRREFEVLEAQGVDPMVYLIMPRVFGIAVSVFGLAVIFTVVSLGSGYLSGLFLVAAQSDPTLFINRVLGALTPTDLIHFLVKTLVPGLLTGTICTLEGIQVRDAATEVPKAATRGVVRSMGAVVVVSALVSLLTYG